MFPRLKIWANITELQIKSLYPSFPHSACPFLWKETRAPGLSTKRGAGRVTPLVESLAHLAEAPVLLPVLTSLPPVWPLSYGLVCPNDQVLLSHTEGASPLAVHSPHTIYLLYPGIIQPWPVSVHFNRSIVLYPCVLRHRSPRIKGQTKT